MSDIARDIHGVRVLVCAIDGPVVSDERNANDLMSAAWERNATLVALPVSRLADEFFELSTRIAGDVIQKFVNHHLRLAVIGDVSAWTAKSGALRDFVYEANRGQTIWFIEDLEGLDRLLLARKP